MMQRRKRVYLPRNDSAPRIGTSRGVVPTHKYTIGQTVRFVSGPVDHASREMQKSVFAAAFVISRLLPDSGFEHQYRVKNTATGHERVAGEGEISPVDGE